MLLCSHYKRCQLICMKLRFLKTGEFPENNQFTHPLTTMPMEGWVKRLSPQNTIGVSGVNSVAAKSNTIEVNRDFFKCKKTTEKMPPCCLCGVIQVSESSDIHTWNGHSLHTSSCPRALAVRGSIATSASITKAVSSTAHLCTSRTYFECLVRLHCQTQQN